MAKPIERVHYYARQRLGAQDFLADQAYHRDMRRRHQLGPHTWGVVTGLQLDLQELPGRAPGEVEVTLMPGMAVDGYGRQIVVLEPHRLGVDLMDGLVTSELQPLWIRWISEPAGPTAGDPCDERDLRGRIEEGWELLLGDPTRWDWTRRSDIRVGRDLADTEGFRVGVRTPLAADESIPHQGFPADGDLDRWLVPIGKLHADGASVRYLTTAPHKVLEGRRWAGFVGSSILAPNAELVVSDRPLTPPREPPGATPAPPPAEEEEPNPAVTVIVEGGARIGNERARGDLELRESAILLRNREGKGAKLDVRRTKGADGREHIDVELGDNRDQGNCLRVGPLDPTDDDRIRPVLSVCDDDTTSLKGPLDVAGTLTVGGDLDVAGTANLHGALNVDEAVDFAKDLHVHGTLTVDKNTHLLDMLKVDGLLDLTDAPDKAIHLDGGTVAIGREDGGTRFTGAQHRFATGADVYAKISAAGLDADLARLDLTLNESFFTTTQRFTSNSTRLLRPVADGGVLRDAAHRALEGFAQAVYLRLQLSLEDNSWEDTVTLTLQRRGGDPAPRRFVFESARDRGFTIAGIDIPDDTTFENDQTYFVWMPPPTPPSQYEIVVSGLESGSELTVNIDLLGGL